jgi:hypothetical protein
MRPVVVDVRQKIMRWLENSEEADSRIRTDDLIITNDLLYQLSYIGICSLVNGIKSDPQDQGGELKPNET